MSQLSRDIFKTIDNVIEAINKLNREGSQMASLNDRVELLMGGMGLIERAFENLLEFKEYNTTYVIQDLIQYDYDLAEYAEKFRIGKSHIA